MSKNAEKEWCMYAKRVLEREIGGALVKKIDIAKRLNTTPDNFNQKLRRGTFSAGFFLQILDILEIDTINMSEIKKKGKITPFKY